MSLTIKWSVYQPILLLSIYFSYNIYLSFYIKDGKFWPARLNSTKLTDVYGVVIDSQRGNRPTILPRDDILKEAVSKSIFLSSIYLSIYLSLSLCIYLSFYMSINLSIYLSICQSIYLSIYIWFIYLTIHPSIYPSAQLYFYLCIFLSSDDSDHKFLHPCECVKFVLAHCLASIKIIEIIYLIY